jgi:hypothetical protein
LSDVLLCNNTHASLLAGNSDTLGAEGELGFRHTKGNHETLVIGNQRKCRFELPVETNEGAAVHAHSPYSSIEMMPILQGRQGATVRTPLALYSVE